jgi:hypothetical protein
VNVWYAAYGSNLSRARFESYLRGGTPAGARHVYPGCRDASDPADDRPWDIDRELLFGGASRTWGGGVALLGPGRTSETKVRLYLLALEQFEDIVAQENWLACGAVTLANPLTDEIDIGAAHTYGLVVRLGAVDEIPVLTITQHREAQPAAPSAAYLGHIAQGLKESHELSGPDIIEYLMTKRGVTPHFTSDELARTLAHVL